MSPRSLVLIDTNLVLSPFSSKNIPQLQFEKKFLLYFIGWKPLPPEDLTGKEAEKAQKEEQSKIDNAVELTEKEETEKEKLLNQNEFADWSKREFRQFINASEKYGRHELESIAREVETKTFEEVFFILIILYENREELNFIQSKIDNKV